MPSLVCQRSGRRSGRTQRQTQPARGQDAATCGVLPGMRGRLSSPSQRSCAVWCYPWGAVGAINEVLTVTPGKKNTNRYYKTSPHFVIFFKLEIGATNPQRLSLGVCLGANKATHATDPLTHFCPRPWRQRVPRRFPQLTQVEAGADIGQYGQRYHRRLKEKEKRIWSPAKRLWT